MKTITYTNFDALLRLALKHGKTVYETDTSYSFRLFKGKNYTELHIMQKK